MPFVLLSYRWIFFSSMGSKKTAEVSMCWKMETKCEKVGKEKNLELEANRVGGCKEAAQLLTFTQSDGEEIEVVLLDFL